MPVDETVIGQYVQHPGIAKDFANYYDLYNQYKNDYHVEEILSGTIRPQTLERLKDARFDEKLSLIGLLMGCLGGDFKDWQAQNMLVTRLYEILKAVKAAGDDIPAMEAVLLEHIRTLEANVLTRRSDAALIRALYDAQKNTFIWAALMQ